MAYLQIRKRVNKSGTTYAAAIREKVEGRDVVVWSGTYKTKGDAQAAGTQNLDGVNKGLVKRVDEKMTFNNFVENVWLPTTRARVDRPDTVKKYKMYHDRHWSEHFGSLKLNKIEPVLLNRWFELKKK